MEELPGNKIVYRWKERALTPNYTAKEKTPMGNSNLDIQKMIEAAVLAAYEAGVKGVDEKIQAAVNLAIPIAVKIGAEVGAEIGARTGAEHGAKAMRRVIERESKSYRKAQYDWKYHNTKLLIRNYRRLNEYYQNAVFSTEAAEEVDVDFADIMRSMGRPTDEEIFVESIQQNYITTRIIMTHVKRMLECYRLKCTSSDKEEEQRHWRILNGLYLSDVPQSAEELAQQEGIDKRTVYRDIDTSAAELTVLFFGVWGIDNL